MTIYTGADILGDSIRSAGFTYISVQWSRAVTEVRGHEYGVIEDGRDGYQIIRDAAELLRHPAPSLFQLVQPIAAVEYVVGHGHSQGAGLLRGMMWSGENRTHDGQLAFDGFLLTGHNGLRCYILNNDDTADARPGRSGISMYAGGGVPCAELPDDGKLILIRTQSEVEANGPVVSVSHNVRVYDLAGVAHVPSSIALLRQFGANRQNPVSWRPVARAMLDHLVAWVERGREPPQPVPMEGGYDEDGQFQLGHG